MLWTVDVLEVDVLVVDVLELDVLGARRQILLSCNVEEEFSHRNLQILFR
jgi:hypothetical protein